MGRNILGEVQMNQVDQQFDDSLENIENKENSSTNTTFTKDSTKSIFYEIPNTPKSIKKRNVRLNSKIREEIRKSLNNTVTLRRTIERQQLEKQKQLEKQQQQQQKVNNKDDNNATYIKEDKKSKTKICDVIYLKTIDNLLNTINTELEFGKINSRFVDDRKYIEIFQENINKLNSHLQSKLRFNSGLKILKWYRSRLEIRKTRRIIDDIKRKRNAAIVIQSNWRRYQVQKQYSKAIYEYSVERNKAAQMIQRWYRLCSNRKKQLVRQLNEQKEQKETKIRELRYQSAVIIQKCWRRYLFKSRLNEQIELRKLIKNQLASKIQRCWRSYQFKMRLDNMTKERKMIRLSIIIQRCWRAYQLRKKLNLLVKQKKYLQQLENGSASIIQRWWRVYVMKRNLTRLLDQHRNEMNLIQNKSALLIQRQWKNYVLRKTLNQLIVRKQIRQRNKSASIIQRVWRSYQLNKCLNSRIAERKLNKLRRFELETRSALLIQSKWRMYQAKKQLSQLKFERKRNAAASLIQKNWLVYVWRKNLANEIQLNKTKKANQLCVKNEAASKIQRVWRSYLIRKQQLEEQRLQQAATQIQKTWRGYTTRTKCKRASGIFERIIEVNKNAILNQHQTVGEKTSQAIQKLLNYKYHGTALHMLKELENTTNLSNESCIQMANVMIIEVLLKVVSECNRSEPCLQIIKLVFSVILNIAKNDKALPLLCSIPSLKESIIETLNKHHKKTGIFLKAITLLYILLKHEKFPDSPAISIKIRRLLSKISDNHQFTSRNSKNDKIYNFDPRWLSKKQIRAQFYTTKQAIDAFSQIYI